MFQKNIIKRIAGYLTSKSYLSLSQTEQLIKDVLNSHFDVKLHFITQLEEDYTEEEIREEFANRPEEEIEEIIKTKTFWLSVPCYFSVSANDCNYLTVRIETDWYRIGTIIETTMLTPRNHEGKITKKNAFDFLCILFEKIEKCIYGDDFYLEITPAN